MLKIICLLELTFLAILWLEKEAITICNRMIYHGKSTEIKGGCRQNFCEIRVARFSCFVFLEKFLIQLLSVQYLWIYRGYVFEYVSFIVACVFCVSKSVENILRGAILWCLIECNSTQTEETTLCCSVLFEYVFVCVCGYTMIMQVSLDPRGPRISTTHNITNVELNITKSVIEIWNQQLSLLISCILKVHPYYCFP